MYAKLHTYAKMSYVVLSGVGMIGFWVPEVVGSNPIDPIFDRGI